MARSKFKRIALKLLKWFGITIALILVVLSIVVIVNLNYDRPSLYVSKEYLQKEYAGTDTQVIAQNLVAQMSLDEKIAQMYGEPYGSGMAKLATNFLVKKRFAHIYVGENERLGIPPWVLSDGPRGARVLGEDVEGVTTFPVGMARGASWNTDLEYRINQVIASEMRANKVNYAATPCINLLRHPGWGRAQETYGEDPWLLGEFGVAAVKGLEKHNVMACPKHFALNSIENSRWVVDVEVDERTLREVYLPHFKKTVQEGKPASIMSAYNSVNGEFCGSNKELLTHILRDDWGFEGFVTTDWLMGVYDGVKGVQAGLDVEMPFQQVYTPEVIQEGLDNGEISKADIDKIVTRSLTTRLKYALVNDQVNYPTSDIGKPSSIALAREAAEESMVLLKNEGVLPFKKQGGKTIAVIGRLADLENTGDRGSSDSTPLYVETPFEGIKKQQEAQGNKVVLDDGSNLERAKELAQNADEVILVVGFTHEDEGEYIIFSREQMEEAAEAGKSLGKVTIGGDRKDLSLLEQDERLIKALHPMNDDLVVVYVGGSAIDMSAWEDDVPAILFSWYAGMEGGTALANILYGDANPSGKLPFSIAKEQKDYPPFTPYTKKFEYGYYHGYTLFDKKGTTPAYPFGYGLSYTDFAYDSLVVKTHELSTTEPLEVEVNVSNTGAVDGKEVVQLYVGFSNSAVDRPVKLLRGFKKVHLKAGETKKVMLDVPTKDLAWYNPDTKNWEVENMAYEVYVGSSSAEGDLLQSTFVVK